MSANVKAPGIDRMSVPERIALIEEIWDSIESGPEAPPLTEAQREDLQRRVTAYEADPKAGSSWEDVKARSRGRP